MKQARKTNRQPNEPKHHVVSVGVDFLAWRFTPGSLPGLPNLLPVLCTIGAKK